MYWAADEAQWAADHQTRKPPFYIGRYIGIATADPLLPAGPTRDEHGVGQGVDSADAYEMTGKGSGIQMTSTLGNQMPLDGDFQSVEVEIGEEDGEDDFDFKKSMEESLGDDVVVAGAGREKKGPGGSGKKVVPDVLE